LHHKGLFPGLLIGHEVLLLLHLEVVVVILELGVQGGELGDLSFHVQDLCGVDLLRPVLPHLVLELVDLLLTSPLHALQLLAIASVVPVRFLLVEQCCLSLLRGRRLNMPRRAHFAVHKEATPVGR
jgi:hypothetical protein